MMVYAIIVARQLGPNELGVYSGLYAILGVSITIVNFGLDQWMLKEAHNHISIRVLSGRVISVKLLLGSIWGLLCFLILPITRQGVFTPVIVVLAVGDVLFDVIFNSITVAWNIERDIKMINIFLLLSRIGKLVGLLLLVFFGLLSPLNIIISRLSISFIVFIFSISKLRPIVNFKDFRDLKQILRRSSDFGFSEILATIYGNVDVAILTYFSITNTGLYSPATGIIHALFIIPNSFYTYLLPHYVKVHENNQEDPWKKIVKQVLFIFVPIGTILAIILFIGGQFIVTLILGMKYAATGELLTILSPIMFFKSISFGLALLIVLVGDQRKRLFPQFLISIFNIVMNILLIPYFGLKGVAWIYSISELGLMIGYLIIVLQRSRKFTNEKETN